MLADHELVIVRTDLAPDDLPKTAEGRVNETDQDISIIGRVEEVAPGDVDSITLDLEPGSYVLICNILDDTQTGEIRSHYQEGMATGFTVTTLS